MNDIRSRILAELDAERHRQDSKFGEQNHDDYRWLAILAEEVGEAAQAALHDEFEPDGHHRGQTRKEVLHAAAVAVSWLECMARRQAIAPAQPDSAHETTDEYLARLREFHEASEARENERDLKAPPAPCTLHSWPHDDSPDARCMVCGVTRRVAHEARELIKMWQTAGWLFVYNIAGDAFATMIAGNGNPPIDSPQAVAAVTAWMRAQKEAGDE